MENYMNINTLYKYKTFEGAFNKCLSTNVPYIVINKSIMPIESFLYTFFVIALSKQYSLTETLNMYKKDIYDDIVYELMVNNKDLGKAYKLSHGITD